MRWQQIPGYSSYEISEYGQVRRKKGALINKVGHRKQLGGLLKPSGEYRSYALVNDKGKIIYGLRSNRLVLMTFVGPPATSKQQALHWDDDRSNNHITNLRWGTAKQNGEDKIRNGNSCKGARNHAAVLTDLDVLQMRIEYAAGASLHELAIKYGMTLMPVWAAVTGKSWIDVPGAVKPKGQGVRSLNRIPRGEKNGNAKLTAPIVRKIRALLLTTTGAQIARQFGVTKHIVSSIRRGKIWRHV